MSASISLVGSEALDSAGMFGVVVVGASNYVAVSPDWNNGSTTAAGAMTWCNGATGCIGPVTTANSLYGGSVNDHVGPEGVLVLSNGNYVVRSQQWDSAGIAIDAGAFTCASGSSGITGLVSPSNSLVGSHRNDALRSLMTPLSNGNFVVAAAGWDNGTSVDVGAVVWGNGTTGVVGTIS